MNIRHVLLPALLLLAPAASAQVICQPGLVVEFIPKVPVVGEPILVSLKNNSPNTFTLPGPCVFQRIRTNNCSGTTVFTVNCTPSPLPLTPGSMFLGFWDQRDDNGMFVPPGTYAFDVQFASGPGCCPTVTIGSCPAPEPYGAGDPGSGQFIPDLSASGSTAVGGALSLTISNGLGGALTGLFIGLQPAFINAPFGTFLVDPGPPLLQVYFPLGGTLNQPGAGTITFPASIPNNTNLVGLSVYMQALVQDANASGGLSHTQGLALYICP